MDLIGGENNLNREFEYFGDNYNVFILHKAIRVHQKCKTSRTKADSIGINRVCHIEHLVDTCVVLGEAASIGSTSQYVGSGVSKVAVLSCSCIRTDYDLRGHLTGKILQHAGILMYAGSFIWAQCSLYEVVGLIIVIDVVTDPILFIGGINISIMLRQ